MHYTFCLQDLDCQVLLATQQETFFKPSGNIVLPAELWASSSRVLAWPCAAKAEAAAESANMSRE